MLNSGQTPAASLTALARRSNYALLWCAVGTAVVCTSDGHRDHRQELHAGDLLVVPAGVSRTVDVHRDSVVIPLLVPGDQRPGDGARTFSDGRHLGTGWTPWMLHHFASGSTLIRPPGYRHGRAVDQFYGRRAGVRTDGTDQLPFPTSDGALRIANVLHHDLQTATTAEALATGVGISTQTLRRTFLRETGLTFNQWRTRCRLAASTDYLAAGYPVSWTADQAGFASVQGFIRSFRNHYGTTPAAWSRCHPDTRHPAERVTRFRAGASLAHTVAAPADTPPDIPATDSDHPRVYDGVHDILWMYTGTARITINGHTYNLTTGDAIWIPAGSTHYTEMDAGSVGLPLMFQVDEVDVSPVDVAVVKIPPSHRNYMLFHTVANMTAIQPENYDRLEVLELFAEHTARERERNLNMPATGPARAVAKAMVRDLRDRRGVEDWAAAVGSTVAELNASFHDQTGRRALQWRTLARVRHAADLLASGTTPNAAARRCGYAHLSQFSRDFSKHYGMSPRQWVGN
ncbi:helix-turn-helix transcriptional regulator [Corynebacterium nuruki]|uniref:helix-turn-helix transcriptional regulator n=1 Tax=Corynebacterium nuruki TaxID=1032851 RepID=UPI0039BF4689